MRLAIYIYWLLLLYTLTHRESAKQAQLMSRQNQVGRQTNIEARREERGRARGKARQAKMLI